MCISLVLLQLVMALIWRPYIPGMQNNFIVVYTAVGLGMFSVRLAAAVVIYSGTGTALPGVLELTAVMLVLAMIVVISCQ